MNKLENTPALSCLDGSTVEYSTLSGEEQEKILHLQQAILESVARGADHMAIINEVCRLEEQLLPNAVGSVMLMDDANEFLNVYAAPSVPAEGIALLNRLRPGPGGGSCGNVIYRQEPQFVSDTLTDPRWQDLRHLAYDFNLCACWSVPIYSGQRKVVGTFALSSFEHRSPSPFHRKLLEIGSSIIGIVLERNKSQESLRLFQKVFEGSEEGIMITDPNKTILLVNSAFTKMMGYTQDEVVGETPKKLASGHHNSRFYAAMWSSINNFGHWHGEIWNRRKNGEIFPEWLAISTVNDKAGNTTHYIGIFSDISERKNAEEQIRYLSSHDVLTGLPNRILLKNRLETAIAFAARSHGKVALLSLDLDQFKMLNDSMGHAAGDELLRCVTAQLKCCVRDTDTLCRSGGDEFLIALANMPDTDSISTLVDEILERIAKPFVLEGRHLSLSCSIGVAVYPDDGDDFETLMKLADKAMYQAKDAGRNTYRYVTEQLNSDSLEFMRITHELREAVKCKQFTVHFQPQIELATGDVVGAEALVRWNHPVEGLIPPGRFISIAEQTGLIVEIGEWVLHEACRQAMAWRRAGMPPLLMAVNMSAVQFKRGNVENLVRGALESSGLEAQYLEIELTESILLHDMDHMLSLLNNLKDIGLKLAIDDFGTGYSSLAYLKKFKIDRLKIDQSFVRDIASDPNDAAIVRAIVQMAHTLNLRVIAEGVENQEMLHYLSSCQCDEVQGYHFAKPMPPDAFAAFILGRKSEAG
ncbi:putative bifunctional diguanylate cyclase/phosphodiesterase [Methylomonas methanica]|uniref:cyclic-guanylate-specific phosphodiesterase n=1 Tax=Methylomonas methanica (strain DSM 25384 / MC09) TaxID=857087 RepID=F9ZYR2_METMM|nr:EAL domain-containing protein [Methylomonas methanica]AEF98608.1 diguanylate cyclase/phosphodiesterase with PAS/PAC and GAF sensor(s) [Methylomonas methanica MC09]